jgi:hypothetical protein
MSKQIELLRARRLVPLLLTQTTGAFVLPHREMFPRRQALPHQACSHCLTGLRRSHSSSSIS